MGRFIEIPPVCDSKNDRPNGDGADLLRPTGISGRSRCVRNSREEAPAVPRVRQRERPRLASGARQVHSRAGRRHGRRGRDDEATTPPRLGRPRGRPPRHDGDRRAGGPRRGAPRRHRRRPAPPRRPADRTDARHHGARLPERPRRDEGRGLRGRRPPRAARPAAQAPGVVGGAGRGPRRAERRPRRPPRRHREPARDRDGAAARRTAPLPRRGPGIPPRSPEAGSSSSFTASA